MTGQLPYIGRGDILAQIAVFLNEENTRRVVCIRGEGGIGKTRLLEESRYLAPAAMAVMQPIDFDDLAYHVEGYIERRIAQLAGEQYFKDFWRELRLLQLLKRPGGDASEINQQEARVNEIFLQDFTQFSTEKRTLISLDTSEKLMAVEIWQRLVQIALAAKNVVFLVAGRAQDGIWEERFSKNLEQSIGEDILIKDIHSLTNDESRQYLRHKQEQLHLNIDPGLVEKLIVLVKGRPILLDLAVEWIAREIPLEWLVKEDLETLQALSEKELDETRKKFEASLVRRVTHIHRPMDRLTLTLARVYPLDVLGISRLLRVTLDEARSLYQGACTYVFIKTLPGDRISLHDEMRRMVNAYVWEEVDPLLERRRHDSQLAVAYLNGEREHLEKQIDEKVNTSIALDMSGFMAMEAMRRELAVVRAQLLEHTLFVDVNQGVALFEKLFDEDTRSHRVQARNLLVSGIMVYRDELSPLQRYAVDSRRAKHLWSRGNFTEARDLADDLLAAKELKPAEQVDALTKLAESEIGLGNLKEALNYLNRARELCEKDAETRRWLPTVLNNQGRANRMMGRYKAAVECYERALRETQIDETQIASTLNNIGYMASFDGRYRSALNYCLKGLDIRQKHDWRKEVGASCTTIGEVYRNWGKYDDALSYYDRALEIFEPEKDLPWMARLYSYRGAVLRLKDDFKGAEADLQRSLRLSVRMEQPWAHHVLGCVYWNQNQLERALEQFRKSDELAGDVDDVRTHVNNLVGAAEIFLLQWVETEQLDAELVKQIEKRHAELARLVGEGYEFSHHLGRMKRVLAEMEFARGQYAQALALYTEAYSMLGQRSGGYGRRTYFDELEILGQKIDQLAQKNPAMAQSWVDNLRAAWEDEGRDIMRRDELLSMLDVREITIKLGQAKQEA